MCAILRTFAQKIMASKTPKESLTIVTDLVLPSAAYTEQNGLYENLEGRVQECKKASYPIGESLEDWKIFNLIINKLGKTEDLSNFNLLRKWRSKQERKLMVQTKNKKSLKIMSSEDVITFMQSYQRITQQMFKDAVKSSSIIVNLNRNHQIQTVKIKKQ